MIMSIKNNLSSFRFQISILTKCVHETQTSKPENVLQIKSKYFNNRNRD